MSKGKEYPPDICPECNVSILLCSHGTEDMEETYNPWCSHHGKLREECGCNAMEEVGRIQDMERKEIKRKMWAKGRKTQRERREAKLRRREAEEGEN